MNWDVAIGTALKTNVYALAIVGVYLIARFVTQNSRRSADAPARLFKRMRSYIACICSVLCVSALIAAMYYLSHEAPEEQLDPQLAGQILNLGLKMFLCLLPAALLGTIAAYEEDKYLTPQARAERNARLPSLRQPEASGV